MPAFIDLTGKTYGRLTVLKISHRNPKCHCFVWLCRCSCGTVKPILGNALHCGTTTSCGCYQKEVTAINKRKHGHCVNRIISKEWSAWNSMKTRCYYPNFIEYENYGGRGIRVCDRWLASFQNFFDDMGFAPSKQHSIERKNNNGHYGPGNCVWATRSEQQNNTSRNRFLTFNGRRQTISQWAVEIGIHPATLWSRIMVRKWTPEKAITTIKRKCLKNAMG